MGNPVWLYHKDHEAECFDSDRIEELKAKGWVDHPDRVDDAEKMLADEEAAKEEAEVQAGLEAEAAAKEREELVEAIREEVRTELEAEIRAKLEAKYAEKKKKGNK